MRRYLALQHSIYADRSERTALKEMLAIGVTPVLGERMATSAIVDGKVKTSTGREIECDLLVSAFPFGFSFAVSL